MTLEHCSRGPVARLTSSMSKPRSTALAGPRSRRQPRQNSSMSTSPSPLTSRSLNMPSAWEMWRSSSLNSSSILASCRCSWNSSQLTVPELSASAVMKISLMLSRVYMSFVSFALFSNDSTKTPVMTLPQANTVNAMKRGKTRPMRGEISSMSGATAESQLSPPATASKSVSEVRPKEWKWYCSAMKLCVCSSWLTRWSRTSWVSQTAVM
mmetsp:Transcript_67241/g.216978  ORF Transcript_67241/g.216978 Transcript_67241/m.216978 type:complete len:210 (-) Transcript_67241:1094-1723(-)